MDELLAKDVADSLRPLIAAECMKSWHDGVRAGLQMAARIAVGVREELAPPAAEAVLDELVAVLATKADEVMAG